VEISGYLRQLFVLGFAGKAIPEEFKHLLRKDPIGGIILFEENIEDTKQLKELIKEAQALSPLPLFVMVDQEGGETNRIKKEIPQFPSNSFFGEKEDLQGAIFAYGETAKALKGLGINVNLAPVIDLALDPKSSILGERSFGANAELVARLSSLSVEAIQREGVMACAKHFPGLGGVDVDPHLALPSDPRGRDKFSSRDWLPFRATITSGVKLVMTTHLVCPNLDPSGLPASLSQGITSSILHGELGFEGIVITDDLGMGAIRENFPLEETASLAIEAGADLILFCHGFEERLEVMEETLKRALKSGVLRGKIFHSYERIMKAKKGLGLI
jgi:beta-N-acetylhexosaminidase